MTSKGAAAASAIPSGSTQDLNFAKIKQQTLSGQYDTRQKRVSSSTRERPQQQQSSQLQPHYQLLEPDMSTRDMKSQPHLSHENKPVSRLSARSMHEAQLQANNHQTHQSYHVNEAPAESNKLNNKFRSHSSQVRVFNDEIDARVTEEVQDAQINNSAEDQQQSLLMESQQLKHAHPHLPERISEITYASPLTEDDFEPYENYQAQSQQLPSYDQRGSNSKQQQSQKQQQYIRQPEKQEQKQCYDHEEKNANEKELLSQLKDSDKQEILDEIEDAIQILDSVIANSSKDIHSLQQQLIEEEEENQYLLGVLSVECETTEDIERELREEQQDIDELVEQTKICVLEQEQSKQKRNKQSSTENNGNLSGSGQHLQQQQQQNSSSSSSSVSPSPASRSQDVSQLLQIIQALSEDNKALTAQNQLLNMENAKALELARNARHSKFLQHLTHIVDLQQPLSPQNNTKNSGSKYLNSNNVNQRKQYQSNNNSNSNSSSSNINNLSNSNNINSLNYSNSINNTSSYQQLQQPQKQFKYLSQKK